MERRGLPCSLFKHKDARSSTHCPSDRKSSNTRRRYCAHAGSTINRFFHLCTHTAHHMDGAGMNERVTEWVSDHCQGLLYVMVRRIPLKSGRLRLLGRNHRWHQQDLLEHPLNRSILLIWHRGHVECVTHYPHMSWKSFPAQLWHTRDSQRRNRVIRKYFQSDLGSKVLTVQSTDGCTREQSHNSSREEMKRTTMMTGGRRAPSRAQSETKF